MTVAVVAEKPSVARDIARVVGAGKRAEGYLYGNGYVVTWALGHLVRLAQPGEMRPEWERWSLAALPMLPSSGFSAMKSRKALTRSWTKKSRARGLVRRRRPSRRVTREIAT